MIAEGLIKETMLTVSMGAQPMGRRQQSLELLGFHKYLVTLIVTLSQQGCVPADLLVLSLLVLALGQRRSVWAMNAGKISIL